MILNISRAKSFQSCRVKAFNEDILRLTPPRTADALLIGSAFHEGIAEYFSTGDRRKAMEKAESAYRERIDPSTLFEEEKALLEKNILLSTKMVELYSQHYDKDSFTVLYPEVEFMVPLPNSLHHCFFTHQLLIGSTHTINGEDPFTYGPYRECTGYHPGDAGVQLHCMQPHYLRGKTDGVVSWKKMIWLLEHKTSALTGDIFYAKYEMDYQITGYLYGIWKTLGILPHGAIVNLIKKPRRGAKDPFDIGFEREPFLRTQADLLSFEKGITGIAEDYEAAILAGPESRRIYPNPENCLKFNRRCNFHEMCKNNRGPMPGEFSVRPLDYVNLAYYELLGLTPPPVAATEEVNIEE